MRTQNSTTTIEEDLAEDVDISDINTKRLVVFNDDVNSFEHVIDTFCDILKHTPEQAEQCAWLIHLQGKCTVKEGLPEQLKPLAQAICERGIDARVL